MNQLKMLLLAAVVTAGLATLTLASPAVPACGCGCDGGASCSLDSIGSGVCNDYAYDQNCICINTNTGGAGDDGLDCGRPVE